MDTVSYSSVILIIISTVVVLGFTSLFAVYLGKKSKSSEDWAVGNRSLPMYVIVGTQYATAMGGGVLVAHVGLGYNSGWAVLFYGISLMLGLFTLAIIAKWLRSQNFTTVPDVIRRIYGDNKFLLNITAILCIVVPFGWTCTQLVSFGKLYFAITGINPNLLMTLFALVSLAFVLPAGLTSVAWKDFVFGCLMLVLSIISIGLATNMAGGWSNVVANVPAEIVEFPKGMFSVGLYTIALWFLAIIPGTVTNQMYFQRIFAVDDVKKVRKSLVISAIVIFTAELYAVFLGLAIRSINPNLQGEIAAGWFLTQVPVWFLAIYSGFLVATIMSTIDSSVQSVAVSMTHDIYLKNTKSEINDKKLVSMQRIFSVAAVALALTLSIAYPQALNWLVATYSYSASGLLFPIFLGYFLKDKNVLTAKGAIGSMILGFAGCAIGQITKAPIPYVAYGLIGSLLGLLIISYLTRNDLKKVA